MKTLQLIENYLHKIKEQNEDATLPQDESTPQESDVEQVEPDPLSTEAEVYFAELLKKALGLKINDSIELNDSDKQTIAAIGEGDKTNAKQILDTLSQIINKYII